MKEVKTLALFDFDGTITYNDSLWGFLRYALAWPVLLSGLVRLSPWLLLYSVGLLNNHRAKQKLFGQFFKHWSVDKFQTLAEGYSINQIPVITKPKALERLTWHQDQGHQVVVVSASIENWLAGWCKDLNLKLIATQIEVREGSLTGRFRGKNCHGQEKVTRIREELALDQYESIYAYGDGKGDRAMLAMADKPFYKWL